MTWVKLDDGFTEHPKIIEVGPLGQVVHVQALCYSARNLTDGQIPRRTYLGLVAGLEGSRVLSGGRWIDAKTIDWSARLVAAGLWEVGPGDGWTVHNYLAYNPSKANVEAERRERKRGRAAGGKARAARARRRRDGKFASTTSSTTASFQAGEKLADAGVREPSEPEDRSQQHQQADQLETSPVPLPQRRGTEDGAAPPSLGSPGGASGGEEHLGAISSPGGGTASKESPGATLGDHIRAARLEIERGRP